MDTFNEEQKDQLSLCNELTKQEPTEFKEETEMDIKNVFSSDIKRDQKVIQNNLYDLIKVVPATPTIPKPEKEYPCSFQPNTDKIYIPKKRNRMSKVKTVRDIRKTFESDVLPDLTQDLDKQQKFLLKKITAGSSREDNTKMLAKNTLKCDKPVSRTAWQMLMTLNPEEHPHAIQYVLWKGRRIRVNGSRGGKNNFLCQYDLANRKKLRKENVKIFKKMGLIKNSLSIRFKPGPLSKKKNLDDSFQRYNLGSTELVNLPKVGLNIKPTYGVTLEPNIANFMQKLRDVNGTISEKWAEFAVSAVGSLQNSMPTQLCTDSGVTFELNYQSNQDRMLMRRDGTFLTGMNESEMVCSNNLSNTAECVQTDVDSEVKTILARMVDCVEISLQQDTYTRVETSRKNSTEENVRSDFHKEKTKKRFSELDRLDVTIIRLPQDPESITVTNCKKAHCALGCVCSSLQCEYNLKQHCGRTECMFDCKCDFSKYKAIDSLDSDCPDLIPGLINLDNELHMKLAKEEQKFHQTVVMTGEKSILLKPEKRNWKASKRYSEFYSSMSLKNEIKSRQTLSVVVGNLNLKNVEPWCMVHNLYKCFCKGLFAYDIQSASESEVNKDTEPLEDSSILLETSKDCKNSSKSRIEPRYVRKETTDTIEIFSDDNESVLARLLSDSSSCCARVRPYKGRKYKDTYYTKTNKKIFEMEENDANLRKKMLGIIKKTESDFIDDLNKKNCKNTPSSSSILVEKDLNDEDSTGYSSETSMKMRKRFSNDVIFNDVPTKTAKPETITKNTPLNDLNVDDRHTMTMNDGKSSSLKIENDTAGYTSENSTKSSSSTANVKQKSIIDTISNKTKLISWLETSYKQYKQRVDNEGASRKSLEPPKHGKVALYPWEFILSRYRERKNLFMVSKQKPYRIFMAIDTKNSFFDHCINIDDIRFADLHQYPATIKNLLTNATDLKDNFCILCGLSHCWELIGSVTKVTDQRLSTEDKSEQEDISEGEHPDTDSNFETCEENDVERQVHVHEMPEENTAELNTESKWFVMTVENDFSEIQFYNKGFFVKYESIIKAINVARMSGKTVRLSSKKCEKQSSGPQFGVYAIPNANEYCVFVGPYDKVEPLGIETVKSITDVQKQTTTRGVWITTKKIDNVKVIDNPLSFIPSKDTLPSNIISIETGIHPATTDVIIPNTSEPFAITPGTATKRKIIKPIKIRKTNGFYHLAQGNFTKSLLKNNVHDSPSHPNQKLPATFLTQFKNVAVEPPLLVPFSKTIASSDIPLQNNKPVAEIAPQIKIVDVFSESEKNVDCRVKNKKQEGGMLILKPEEINKRVLEKKHTLIDELSQRPTQNSESATSDQVIEQDIENFITNSVECTDSNTDAFLISDEEDNSDGLHSSYKAKEIWIECQNNEHLGWIKGRKNGLNQISFEFPGFVFTDFYDSEEEVFSKINQVLSRKIYVPRSIKLEWRIVEHADDLKVKNKLKAEDLGADFVLTKRGLRHKRDLMANTGKSKSLLTSEVDKAVDAMSALEDKYKSLEDQSDILMSKLQLLRPSQGTSKQVPNVAFNKEELGKATRDISSTHKDDKIKVPK